MPKLEAGSIVKGTVTGIQPYGAFVAIDDDIQGLVHISEVSHQFVKDIHDFIKVGDEVTVKVLSVDEKAKRASLSMRAVKEMLAVKNKTRQPKLKEIPETAGGFHILKEKLKEWIEQSKYE
ncbi:S1 domain-containing post-transcriptional regulator GSP13 [Anoxybacillus sp. J5B_2022]|uniref:S1 domain-containing post-transcriptional regulator GSP13 n=1 Tax=Anoxybacillus sp. J5B_2022 TaxID=3003246 RepID=UPI002285A88F|nr:S1 domain-containing post-transcriptional regulator GSP13 [Anoxybacillus sp. J5B_2022]MCZ0756298.1 S1 domain-containing post-transcriptional regulator GSP13 [Anoxybacillus sp. J5B_2022]